MAVPGRVGRDPADPHHVAARRADQRRHGHGPRVRPGPLPVPGATIAVGTRRPPARDPHARHRRHVAGALRPELARSAASLADLGIDVIFTPIAIMLALLDRHASLWSCGACSPSCRSSTSRKRRRRPRWAPTDGSRSGASSSLRSGSRSSAARCSRSPDASESSVRSCSSRVTVAGETLTAPVFIFQLANQFRPAEAAAVATCCSRSRSCSCWSPRGSSIARRRTS